MCHGRGDTNITAIYDNILDDIWDFKEITN